MPLNNLHSLGKSTKNTWAWHQEQLSEGLPEWYSLTTILLIADAQRYLQAYRAKMETPVIRCHLSFADRQKFYEDEIGMNQHLFQRILGVEDFDLKRAFESWMGNATDTPEVQEWTARLEQAALKAVADDEPLRTLTGVEAFVFDVCMPCVLVAGATPHELLARARMGDAEARDYLLSVDRHAVLLDGIREAYLLSQSDRTSLECKLWNHALKSNPRKTHQRQVNVRLAAYAHEGAMRLGIKLPQRCIEDLFRAIHLDRYGSGDPDLPGDFESAMTDAKREYWAVKNPGEFRD